MTDKEVVRELARARAALSSLSGLPDEAEVRDHVDVISERFSRISRLVAALDEMAANGPAD